jgi:hypothetical protein
LRADTKFLKGDGFVLEQSYLDNVAQMQLASGFNRAFANEDYVAYSAMNVYLNDSDTFIEKPSGSSVYIATVRNKGTEYAVRYYPRQGLYYMDKSIDEDYKVKLSFNAGGHANNYIMVGSTNSYSVMLKSAFERGIMRFKNQECKSAFFDMLRYTVLV